MTVFYFQPAFTPVIGILFPIFNHVCDATVKFTLFGYCFKSFRDNCINVIIYISQCIHCSHVYTSIPSVAVVHDMPYLVRKIGCGIYHPRTYHSNEVCFNLEINIVSVRIIFPMPGCRRHNTMQYVISGCLVGMP